MEQVTVLMSTYNGKRFLKEQIESILNQSGVEVTLVIRDDGSSDGTKEILKEYGRLDNVKVFFGENEGPAMSFMSLVRDAEMETEYLAYADQDDIWLPEKLKEAVSAIGHRRERAVLYCSNQTVADEEGHGICLRYKEDPPTDLLNIIDKNHIAGCTMVMNSRLTALLKEKRPSDELIRERMHDTWTIAVAASVGKVIYDPRSFICYRQHEDNVVGLKRRNPVRRFKEKLRTAASGKKDYHVYFAEELDRLFHDSLRKDAAYYIRLYRNAVTLKGKMRLLTDRHFQRKYFRSKLSFAAKLLIS